MKASKTQLIERQRKDIVEKIIEDMEVEGLSWTRPWSNHLVQQNGITGHVYAGGNRLHLAYISRTRGYQDPRWVTFRQAKERGWRIRTGAKSAAIEKWKTLFTTKPATDAENASDDTVTSAFPCLVGAWRVFNAEDVDGIPPMADPGSNHVSDGTVPVIELLKLSSRCPVAESAQIDQAAYSPLRDVIRMPARSTFASDESYLRTFCHEAVHSTGHPSALDRDMGGAFGSEPYAFEELIAELGSVFTAASLGLDAGDIDDRHWRNHVAYLKSWMSALRDDPAYLFKAASKADRASAYLLERYEKASERQVA